MKLKNYKRMYEQTAKLLDAAVLEAACKSVENDKLREKVKELEILNQAQDKELRKVYGKIEAAKQILLRAKQ